MRSVLLFAVGLAGCATVVPMQTASVVEAGTLRVGPQVTLAAWCGPWTQGVAGGFQCTEYPDGVPLPELRVGGRYGLGHGIDVGASLQFAAQLLAPEKPVQGGLTVDAKLELLRIPTRGPTHVLSAGLLGAGAVAGRAKLPADAQLEWAVPIFYGLQFEKWELALGANVSRRHVSSPSSGPDFDSTRLGFTLGLFKRAPAGLAIQVGYLARPEAFDHGALQLQIGALFDVH